VIVSPRITRVVRRAGADRISAGGRDVRLAALALLFLVAAAVAGGAEVHHAVSAGTGARPVAAANVSATPVSPMEIEWP
jgi:hypothetical protein